jgi:hypothetical protein
LPEQLDLFSARANKVAFQSHVNGSMEWMARCKTTRIPKFAQSSHRLDLSMAMNFNGNPYSYIDNEWKKVEQKIPPSNKGFVNKFAYAADNALETLRFLFTNSLI